MRAMPPLRNLVALLLAVLLLAACAAEPGGTAADGAGAGDDPADVVDDAPAGGPELAVEPTPDAGPGPAPRGGNEDLAFTAATVDGGQIDATSLEGRDVVLWFWAPW